MEIAMKPDSTMQDEYKNKSGRKWLKRFIKAIVCLILIMVLAILAVLLLYAVNLHHKPDLDELLTRLKLAKFPESIRNLHVDMRPYMDDDIGRAAPNRGELLVRFEAGPNDIESFINNSPGIDKNITRPMGPISESDEVPAWWPTNESTDRRYIFGQDDGFIVVYDSSNTVRIWVRYVVNPRLDKIKDFIETVYNDPDTFFVELLGDLYDKVRNLFD
jgi:hypothetical protein